MSRKYALLIAFLITGLIASDVYILSLIKKSPPQQAIISRVIDGDTFVLDDNRTIRLMNINTPEKSEQGNEKAMAFLQQYKNKPIIIEITGIDKYQRNLARAYTLNNTYLNFEIVKQGLGVKFLVDESELSLFSKAEQEAIKNQAGIWNISSYLHCIQTTIIPEDEIVGIRNTCSLINIQGWRLRDESRKFYIFPDMELTEIMLHSSHGTDNKTDLYWNQKTDVWNNDRDTLYLFDSQNHLVNYNSYGY